AFDKDATPDGNRTDIGAWLHQLWTKHAADKRVRGVILLSDGGDNGTRFSTAEKARAWRGVAPILAFGVGDPTKFKKDFGLTKIDAKPEPTFIKTSMKIEAVALAPGFAKTKFHGTLEIRDAKDKEVANKKIEVDVNDDKEQKIRLEVETPSEAGEYKVTLNIA